MINDDNKRLENNERAKAYYYKNRATRLAYVSKYQKENRDKKRVWAKRYRDANKAKRRTWIEKNRSRINASIALYTKKRERVDPSFKIANRLRHRVYLAIKSRHVSFSVTKALGCSFAELRAHLEKQFTSGMSWETYGLWHIDHIIPLAHFDLQEPAQFNRACHYSNLQPLWAKDNILKRDRYGVA